MGRAVANWLGLPPLAGGYLVAVLTTLVAVGCSVGLPDAARPAPSAAAAARPDRAAPAWPLAVVVLAAAQVAMVLVMSVTPLHMARHGSTLDTAGIVVSAHTVGMYGFRARPGLTVAWLAGARSACSSVAAHGGSILATVTPSASGWRFGLFATGIG